MKLPIILFVVMLIGCVEKDPEREAARGRLRHQLFVECMELAAKMTRQGDDDVSDVVEACSSQSYYISNHMSK